MSIVFEIIKYLNILFKNRFYALLSTLKTDKKNNLQCYVIVLSIN